MDEFIAGLFVGALLLQIKGIQWFKRGIPTGAPALGVGTLLQYIVVDRLMGA